jgi:hypothetical protein
MKRAVASLCISVAVTLVACAVSVSDFAGKSCEVAEDCPDGYTCVAARPGAGRTCEVLGLPDITDAGGTPTGPVPTYCKEVQPLLNTYCTSNCHGADHTRSGQTGFQLDIYESTSTVKGAKEMAPRIQVRAARFKDMPPVGNPVPTDEEREVLGNWAAGGAPFCTDGGVSPDGGVPDGGP